MSCSNCFNDCAEIVSDKCVRYTGIPIPALGIQTGDTLAAVDLAITTYLQSVLTGEGVIITVPSLLSCALVNDYLPVGPTVTSVQLFTALIQAACFLESEVIAVAEDIATLNADYTIDCLDGVTSSSNTHLIVQAIITKLCETSIALTALALDVDTNYVKLADLDSLIAAYIAGQTTSTQQYTKMIPYTVVEYYGTLSNFDGTGKGLSAGGWDKIYLCNGLNGTPDKRGRVAVGAIQTVPGAALSPVVSPAYTGNPNYALNDIAGTNTIVLTPSQIPSHTHLATVTEAAHTHLIAAPDDAATPLDGAYPLAAFHSDGGNLGYQLTNALNPEATLGLSSSTKTNLSVANSATGGGLSHLNIQPVLACYYIMYLP